MMHLHALQPRSQERHETNAVLETNLNERNEGNYEDNQLLDSSSQWSRNELGATLVWRNVNVFISEGRQSPGKLQSMKRIIYNCTGAIQPGYLVAMMGPKGSGKSTLLSVLAYRRANGVVVNGDILLNGRDLGPFVHEISGFVHQVDLFDEKLTVDEYMNFMSILSLDRRVPKEMRKSIIKNVLERMDLLDVVESRIGYSGEHRGLTNGERKRLAFAVQLFNRPSILFCDEPTAGLDAFSAHQLIAKLSELSQQGISVVCTLNQPTSQLFNMFHNVYLLVNGQVVYTGPTESAMEFFAQHGYPCPDAYNPAEHIWNVLSANAGSGETCRRTTQFLSDAFIVSTAAKKRDIVVHTEMHMARRNSLQCIQEESGFRSPLWYKQLYVIWLRKTLELWRTRNLQWYRFLLKMLLALVIAGCFFSSIEKAHIDVQAIQGCLFMMMCENTLLPMDAIINVLPNGLPLFVREKHAGLYSSGKYYLGIILAMLPGLIIEPFLFVVICYAIIQLKWTLYAFLMTALTIILVMNVSMAFSNFISIACNSVQLTMAYLIAFKCLLLSTSGIFVKNSSLPFFLYWTRYFSWIMYANEVLSIVQWSEAVNITCPNAIQQVVCLQNSEDVLKYYEYDTADLLHNIFVLLLMYFIWHILSYLCLVHRAKMKSFP